MSKSLVTPISKAIIEQLKLDKVVLEPRLSYQLIAAAFGTFNHEYACKFNIPYEKLRANDANQKVLLNFGAVVDKTKELLGLDEFAAQRVALTVIELIRESDIRIGQLRIWLDPVFESKREEMFRGFKKALLKDAYGNAILPSTASLAIAAGLVPSPGKLTLRERFDVVANFPQKSINNIFSELVDLVCQAESYLWLYPPSELACTSSAMYDVAHQHELKISSVEIGLGFSIIQQPTSFNSGRKNYAVFSPMYHYFSRLKSGWRYSTLARSTFRENFGGDSKLTNWLPRGLKSLNRVYGCLTCRMLYVDKSAGLDLPTHCNCPKTI